MGFSITDFLKNPLGQIGSGIESAVDYAAKNAAPLALGAAGLDFAKSGYDKLGDIGEEARGLYSGPDGLAQELQGMMEFQPYTVTSATGSKFGMGPAESTGVDAQGNPIPGAMGYDLTLSSEEQKLQEAQLGRAESMFGLAAVDPAAREQAVFDRMMAAIRPERTRESNRLQGQLQAQGRLGVRTDMYGGTPEQLAMAKAQEEAYSQNMLAAMNFAGQEQSRQAALGSGMLASGYVPQAQLLNAIQPGMTASEQRRAQLAQQTQSYGETYSTGLQALLSSALGQAGQASSVGSGLATAALGGLFGN
tara:strand:- start:104 stop:1021 length:918 start_codon:yes stop_codon:yes gene_type:complete